MPTSWAFMQTRLKEWDDAWRQRYGTSPPESYVEGSPVTPREGTYYRGRAHLVEQMLNAYAKRCDAQRKTREQKIETLETELAEVCDRLRDAESKLHKMPEVLPLEEFSEALRAEGGFAHAPADLTQCLIWVRSLAQDSARCREQMEAAEARASASEASVVAKEDALHLRYLRERNLWLEQRDESAAVAKRATALYAQQAKRVGRLATTAVQTFEHGGPRDDVLSPGEAAVRTIALLRQALGERDKRISYLEESQADALSAAVRNLQV